MLSSNVTEYDCRSEEGITVGLIHSIIFISRILAPRLKDIEGTEEVTAQPTPIQAAMVDLADDEDVLYVVSNYIYSIREQWRKAQMPHWMAECEAFINAHPELINGRLTEPTS